MTDIVMYYINIFLKSHNYNNPIDFINIDNNSTFNQKIRSVISNYPKLIHELAFKNNINICPKYQYITLQKVNNGMNVIDSNFDRDLIDDDRYRYIYIRVNIERPSINHVNCVIIDKFNKWVLIFEPKYSLSYDIEHIKAIIGLDNYDILVPKDIGYNFINRLQKFDYYCQTYVLFVFHIIISNPDVPYNEYALMINHIITYPHLRSYWYHIYSLLKESNFDIENYVEDDMRTIPYDNDIIQDEDGWDIDLV